MNELLNHKYISAINQSIFSIILYFRYIYTKPTMTTVKQSEKLSSYQTLPTQLTVIQQGNYK